VQIWAIIMQFAVAAAVDDFNYERFCAQGCGASARNELQALSLCGGRVRSSLHRGLLDVVDSDVVDSRVAVFHLFSPSCWR
jgi:hypothetical protein